MSICGNATGGFGFPKTFLMTDESGNELTGVVVGEETILTAQPKDVRIGKTFAGEDGIKEGENTITYRTTFGRQCVLPGENFSIFNLNSNDKYDYTELQCIISKFNTNINDSVYTDKIVIGDCLYNVNSIDKVSDVTKNHDDKSISFNILNGTEDTYIIRYTTYREEI